MPHSVSPCPRNKNPPGASDWAIRAITERTQKRGTLSVNQIGAILKNVGGKTSDGRYRCTPYAHTILTDGGV